MPPESVIIKKKICMLGAFAVGKTSLAERFVHDRFDEKYLTTLGVNISQRTLAPFRHPQFGLPVQHLLLIWDIAGFEKFDRITSSYFRGASGALAVMDICRPDTARDVSIICEKFLSVCPDAGLVFVCNNKDLHQNENLDPQVFERTAEQFEAELLLTSAKNGENVDRAFQCLSMKLGGRDGRIDTQPA